MASGPTPPESERASVTCSSRAVRLALPAGPCGAWRFLCGPLGMLDLNRLCLVTLHPAGTKPEPHGEAVCTRSSVQPRLSFQLTASQAPAPGLCPVHTEASGDAVRPASECDCLGASVSTSAEVCKPTGRWQVMLPQAKFGGDWLGSHA